MNIGRILVIIWLVGFTNLKGLHAQVLPVATQAKPPIAWTFQLDTLNANTYQLTAIARLEAGWHIYGITPLQAEGPQATRLYIDSTLTAVRPDSLKAQPPANLHFDPVFNAEVSYWEDSVSLQQTFSLSHPEKLTLRGYVEFMLCNNHTCLLPQRAPFALEVADIPKRKK